MICMENLIRIEYCPKLNQVNRMTRYTIKKIRDFSLELAKEHLELILDKIESEDGVILETFLTHWNDDQLSPNWYWNKRDATLCAFPKYGIVDYKFKKDGNFWVMPNDPYRIKEIWVPSKENPEYFSQIRSICGIKNLLLFRENILESPEKYRCEEYALPRNE